MTPFTVLLTLPNIPVKQLQTGQHLVLFEYSESKVKTQLVKKLSKLQNRQNNYLPCVLQFGVPKLYELIINSLINLVYLFTFKN